MERYLIKVDGVTVDRGVVDKPRSLSLRDLLTIMAQPWEGDRVIVVYSGVAYVAWDNGQWVEFLTCV